MEQRKAMWDILKAENLLGKKIQVAINFIYCWNTWMQRRKQVGCGTLPSGHGLTLVITSASYKCMCVTAPCGTDLWVLHTSPGSKKRPNAVNFLWMGSGSLWMAVRSHLWCWTVLAVPVDDKLSFLSSIGILSNFRNSDEKVWNQTWKK